jgi:hypothetical protein
MLDLLARNVMRLDGGYHSGDLLSGVLDAHPEVGGEAREFGQAGVKDGQILTQVNLNAS